MCAHCGTDAYDFSFKIYFLLRAEFGRRVCGACRCSLQATLGGLVSMFLYLMNRVGLGYGVVLGIAQVIRRHLKYSSLKRTLYPYNHELP